MNEQRWKEIKDGYGLWQQVREELIAEVERLRAALESLKREHPASCPWHTLFPEGKRMYCDCGAEDFNEKIDTLLGK